eukprot:scaffold7518_cov267-Pinguiococcus_pyrenoidosus.AAC.2
MGTSDQIPRSRSGRATLQTPDDHKVLASVVQELRRPRPLRLPGLDGAAAAVPAASPRCLPSSQAFAVSRAPRSE